MEIKSQIQAQFSFFIGSQFGSYDSDHHVEEFNILFGDYNTVDNRVTQLYNNTHVNKTHLYFIRYSHERQPGTYDRAMYELRLSPQNLPLTCHQLNDTSMVSDSDHSQTMSEHTMYISNICVTALFSKPAFYELLIKPSLENLYLSAHIRPLIHISIFRSSAGIDNSISTSTQPDRGYSDTNLDILVVTVRDVIKAVLWFDLEQYSLVMQDTIASIKCKFTGSEQKKTKLLIEYRAVMLYLKLQFTAGINKNLNNQYFSQYIVSII